LKAVLLVGAGGFIGSALRFLLSGAILRAAPDGRLPWSTLIVNLIGCTVAGLLAGMAEKRITLTHDAQLFIFIGILGGFTTFSAFSLETLLLLRRGEALAALAYAAFSVVLCVGAAALAMRAA
jgi:fluoride exporter